MYKLLSSNKLYGIILYKIFLFFIDLTLHRQQQPLVIILIKIFY